MARRLSLGTGPRLEFLKNGASWVIGGVLVALIVGWILDLPNWLPDAWSSVTGFLAQDVTVAIWLGLMVVVLVVGLCGWALRLQAILSRSATAPPFQRGHNAIALPTGFIAVVKTDTAIAAVKALDQSSIQGREVVDYAWWYQSLDPNRPPKNFTADDVLHGTGTGSPMLVGDLTLGWSLGRRGLGWLYFGDEAQPPRRYELALSSEVDISKVDVPSLTFVDYVSQDDGTP